MQFAISPWSPLIVYPAGISYLALRKRQRAIAFIFIILLLIIIFFHRIPNRVLTIDPHTFVSPADGLLHGVTRVGDYVRIAIFLNVHDVHVQYMPISGRFLKQRYRTGNFYPAPFLKKSIHNEQLLHQIETNLGETIYLYQIGGLLVRRIVAYVGEGDHLEQGKLLGMMRFSSRVDLLIPADRVRLIARPGQRVVGGVTPLALYRPGE